MSLIEANDLMVVQKIDNSVDKPVVSFTLDDLDKSLQALYGYVRKSGDTMSGQLQISVKPVDPFPLVITNRTSSETVLYVDVGNSQLVFSDPTSQSIQKLNGSLHIGIDNANYITLQSGVNGKVQYHRDLDLTGRVGIIGNMIHGLEYPEEDPLVYPITNAIRYQASNIGYVKDRVKEEEIQRETNDQYLQTQIDLLKNYLDLFAKFSLQGNYLYDSATNPPVDEYFYTAVDDFTSITEVVASQISHTGVINSLNISEINQGDFLSINPVDLIDTDLIDRTIFGVYKINGAPTENLADNTYTFPVEYITGTPVGATIIDYTDPSAPANGYKIRVIRSPAENGLTLFEAEQLYISKVHDDIGEGHVTFEDGITIIDDSGTNRTEIDCGIIKTTNIQFDLSHLIPNPLSIKGTTGKDALTIVNDSDSSKLSLSASGDIKYYNLNNKWFSTSYTSGSFVISRGESTNSDPVIQISEDPTSPTDLDKNVISFESNKVKHVSVPTDPEDVTDKKYVDDLFLDAAKKSKDNTFLKKNIFITPSDINATIDDINFRLYSETGDPPAMVFDNLQNNLSTGEIWINTPSRESLVLSFGIDSNSNNVYVNMGADMFIVESNDLTKPPLFQIDRGFMSGNSASYTGNIILDEHIVNKAYVLDRISKGIAVKSTTTGAAGTLASVTSSINSAKDGVDLAFVIPKGDKGNTGATGPAGSAASGNFVKNGNSDAMTITKDSTTGVYTISGG
jgi:hypothetical protein